MPLKIVNCGVMNGGGGEPASNTLKSKQNWPQPLNFFNQSPVYLASVLQAAEPRKVGDLQERVRRGFHLHSWSC